MSKTGKSGLQNQEDQETEIPEKRISKEEFIHQLSS